MKYRKLRIAWSIGCGILCLLPIALWVRGKWFRDSFLWQPTATLTVGIGSSSGRLSYTAWHHPPFNGLSSTPDESRTFIYEGYNLIEHGQAAYEAGLPKWGRDAVQSRPDLLVFSLPTWFVTLIAALLAVIPLFRLPRRFSLRALLIVTTLVAVGLGWIVYASRV